VYYLKFLGTYAELQKATLSFVMSVRLSFRLHESTRLPLDGIFIKFDIFIGFPKSVEQLVSVFAFRTKQHHEY